MRARRSLSFARAAALLLVLHVEPFPAANTPGDRDVNCAEVHMPKAELDRICGSSHLMEDGCHKGDPRGAAKKHVAHSFVHIPKTAGTTVEMALGRTMSCHQTAVEHLAERSAEELQIPSFAVVRNPFDRLVSMYKYQLEGAIVFRELNKNAQRQSHRKGIDGAFQGPDGFLRFLRDFKKQQDEHVPEKHTKVTRNGPGLAWWRPQLCYLMDHEYSKCLVDHVVHYETLNVSMHRLESVVTGLPPLTGHARESHHDPFCEYYNETTAQLAREIYAMDFMLLRHSYSPQLPKSFQGACTGALIDTAAPRGGSLPPLGNSLPRHG